MDGRMDGTSERERESDIVENFYSILMKIYFTHFWGDCAIVRFSPLVYSYVVHLFFSLSFVGEPEGNRPLRRHRHRWKYNL
jgi:hypothetical protein